MSVVEVAQAVQAAFLAGAYALAKEIRDRHGLLICVACLQDVTLKQYWVCFPCGLNAERVTGITAFLKRMHLATTLGDRNYCRYLPITDVRRE
jgi:hypothetical protein